VNVEKDVVFGKGGDLELRLDIYRPPAGTPLKQMATIHFHGGGFTRLTKESLSERVLPYARRGYVAIAAQYRLAGQSGFPGLIHDAKTAIRWTRANAARLGILPQRIGVVGHSAGGFHALFTAGTGNRPEFEGTGGNPGVGTEVAACFAYYPATAVPNNMMPSGSSEADIRNASALTHIAKGFPPTVIFHGTADTTIRIDSSERLFKQLRDAGVAAEFHAFDGLPHIFDEAPEFADACGQLADLFLERNVLNPKPAAPARGGGQRRGA
jgi:acetyl esterase/lipase